MQRSILEENKSYTFSDYFKLNYPTEEILSELGYAFQLQKYPFTLPEIEQVRFLDLKAHIEQSLFHFSLDNETARREFLIAPLLLEVALYTNAKIRVEYPLNVTEQLKGTLDYLIENKHNLLIVEAKNADPQRGFTQLAVELIALDKWFDDSTDILYGAVSLGDIWRLGILHRQEKRVIQDVELYRVPADLLDLVQILVGVLA